jgi:hypothetical protein
MTLWKIGFFKKKEKETQDIFGTDVDYEKTVLCSHEEANCKLQLVSEHRTYTYVDNSYSSFLRDYSSLHVERNNLITLNFLVQTKYYDTNYHLKVTGVRAYTVVSRDDTSDLYNFPRSKGHELIPTLDKKLSKLWNELRFERSVLKKYFDSLAEPGVLQKIRSIFSRYSRYVLTYEYGEHGPNNIMDFLWHDDKGIWSFKYRHRPKKYCDGEKNYERHYVFYPAPMSLEIRSMLRPSDYQEMKDENSGRLNEIMNLNKNLKISNEIAQLEKEYAETRERIFSLEQREEIKKFDRNIVNELYRELEPLLIESFLHAKACL